MKEWVIVGGGIHGTYLANVLLRQAAVAPDKVVILDPHDRLLAAWNRMTPLRKLQIGPCARNIVGARNAGRQLLASLS